MFWCNQRRWQSCLLDKKAWTFITNLFVQAACYKAVKLFGKFAVRQPRRIISNNLGDTVDLIMFAFRNSMLFGVPTGELSAKADSWKYLAPNWPGPLSISSRDLLHLRLPSSYSGLTFYGLKMKDWDMQMFPKAKQFHNVYRGMITSSVNKLIRQVWRLQALQPMTNS